MGAAMTVDEAASEQLEAVKHSHPEKAYLSVGSRMQYYSATSRRWLDCIIADVGPHGEVQVDCRPGYWIACHEQWSRLRPPLPPSCDSAPPAATGESEDMPLPPPPPPPPRRPPRDAHGVPATNHAASSSSPARSFRPAEADGYDFISMLPPSAPPMDSSFSNHTGGHTSWSGEPDVLSHVHGPSPMRAGRPVVGYGDPGSFGSIGSFSMSGCEDSLVSAQPCSSNNSPNARSPTSPSERGVGFKPGVDVIAFKQRWPAGDLRNFGRNYERTLGEGVQIPSAFSFASTASFGSTVDFERELPISPGLRKPARRWNPSAPVMPPLEEDVLPSLLAATTSEASPSSSKEAQLQCQMSCLNDAFPEEGNIVPPMGMTISASKAVFASNALAVPRPSLDSSSLGIPRAFDALTHIQQAHLSALVGRSQEVFSDNFQVAWSAVASHCRAPTLGSC